MSQRILVVEDETLIRELLCEFLAEEGYRVDGAGDGQEALAALAEEGYDLVLSDIALPKLNGRDLARALHDDRELRRIPVVLMSAEAETLADGVPHAAFIGKPFDIDEMLETVERALDTAAPPDAPAAR